MIRLWYATHARIGRRGAALMFFALLDAVYALSLLLLTPAQINGSETYRFLNSLMPIGGWAASWAAVGVLCAVQALRRSDRAAFAAASALKVVWGLVQLLGWLTGDVSRGYVAASVWLAFAGFVQLIAGWAEPPRRED